MPDPAPSWLARMREIDGTKWGPSDHAPNPTIQGWVRFIGGTYPNTATYCNAVVNEDYFSWCGLTVGYCMAQSGMAPVFGAADINRFLYAASWLGWGTPVTTPQPGDVVVFDFGGGDHHVTLFEKDNGNGTWNCHGGNQSHQVNQTSFSKSKVMGVRRPSVTAGAQDVFAGALAPGAQGREVTALQSALASQGFDPGGIDGEFGPLTSAAVSSFQRARNLPVTGVADAATLKSLGLPGDGGPQPKVTTDEPTMQVQDLLKTLVDALITKQQGTPAAVTTKPATPAQAPVDVAQLMQAVIAALAGKAPPSQASTAAGSGAVNGTAVPVLSPIDQLLGGQALAGKKTMLAVIAYVIFAILQAAGVAGPATGPTATPTSEIITTLIGAFGALGGLAKIDRLTQVLGLVASQAASPQK